jgi:hypothetical protein
MKVILISLFIVSQILLFTGCDNTMTTNNKNIVFPDSLISYSKYVEPFLLVTCAYQGCHSNETMAAGFSLADWFHLMNDRSGSLVIPGRPDESVLIQALDGKLHCGYEYVWRPSITDNHKKGMRKWVSEGANFN